VLKKAVHLPYIPIHIASDVMRSICMNPPKIKIIKMNKYLLILGRIAALFIYFIYVLCIFLPVLIGIIWRKYTNRITNKPKKSLEYMTHWRYH